jgi:NADPH-dependent 2,4-dienoyl-CoA reductase/sulfur reductase-like enzyme
MINRIYKYVIIGGGLTGGHAIEGIREMDKDGSILLISHERHLPYDRPPLSKKLWFGQKKLEDVFVHNEGFYANNNVDVILGTQIVELDRNAKTVSDGRSITYQYDRLLLATGGVPRTLDIPGGDMNDIYYYRYLNDYVDAREHASEGKMAVVIGGGFIGSELAAALNINKIDVTMVFPESYLVARVFPEDLGRAIQEDYLRRGVKIITGDVPVAFEKHSGKFITRTKNGIELESDMVIVGIGIKPDVDLAQMSELDVANGIVVNEYLQTSDPNIYAAGDNAFFPYLALGGERMRIEHWDNAVIGGQYAGRNMAGANQPYDHMPYFFSDLFDFGYEAVGDINPKLDVFEDWQKEFDTGVVYYLRDGKVRGAMMCNVWDKVDAARELIKESRTVTADDLRGAIK